MKLNYKFKKFVLCARIFCMCKFLNFLSKYKKLNFFAKFCFLKTPLSQNSDFPKFCFTTQFLKIPLSQNSAFPKTHFSKIYFPKIPLSQIPCSQIPTFPESQRIRLINFLTFHFHNLKADVHTNERISKQRKITTRLRKVGTL